MRSSLPFQGKAYVDKLLNISSVAVVFSSYVITSYHVNFFLDTGLPYG